MHLSLSLSPPPLLYPFLSHFTPHPLAPPPPLLQSLQDLASSSLRSAAPSHFTPAILADAQWDLKKWDHSESNNTLRPQKTVNMESVQGGTAPVCVACWALLATCRSVDRGPRGGRPRSCHAWRHNLGAGWRTQAPAHLTILIFLTILTIGLMILKVFKILPKK